MEIKVDFPNNKFIGKITHSMDFVADEVKFIYFDIAGIDVKLVTFG